MRAKFTTKKRRQRKKMAKESTVMELYGKPCGNPLLCKLVFKIKHFNEEKKRIERNCNL